MMDPSTLKKYLAGNATDEEIQQCESYLYDAKNDVELEQLDQLDETQTEVQDSLLDTVRNLSHETTAALVDEDLIAQIQQLVPTRHIGKDELDRILEPAQADDELGRIGRFRVIEFIASGGMGLVFKALDPNLDRAVCIKVLHPMMSTNVEAKARFAREAKAAAKLRNDRIVTVLEVGDHRDLPFLVMQLLDGQSLRRRMLPGKPLPATTAKKYALQIAEGLRYAHSLGYLHRDIKPENIWITPEDDVKLLDFGLARAVNETTHLTNTGTIIGTPSYMSPEQVQGKELDERSDLFSLGSVFYEMLTGENPFGKANVFSTMMSVANDTLALPADSSSNSIPQELSSVLRQLLVKDPTNRVESADQLVQILSADGLVEPTTLGRQHNSNRNGIGRMILAALAGAAIIAAALFLYQITDKGKLVIEAAPGIEVNIKDETIKVHDPQTGKDFTVKIGETKLPSGVYQLSMDSGDFQFSSDVITIRRGDDEIVQISLLPNEQNGAGKTDADHIVVDSPNNSDVASSDVASSDVATPSATNLTLDQIPSLNQEQLASQFFAPFDGPIGSTRPIAPRSYWTDIDDEAFAQSVQPVRMLNLEESGVAVNSNGKLFSTIGDSENFVRIWNQRGQFQLMVPAQGEILSVSWSPLPNTFAVIEQLGDTSQFRTVVWRLKMPDDVADQGSGALKETHWYAEVLKVIDQNAVQLGWSWDGMQLAMSDGIDIRIYDFSLGKIVASPNFGINGEISARPWSADGRYFAARAEDRNDVEVWDMHKKNLFHVFRECNFARFSSEANLISVIKHRHGNWEQWDLSTFERVDTLIPKRENIEVTSSGFTPGSSVWPDSTFQKAACLSKQGDLTIIDLNSRMKTVRKVPFDRAGYRDFDRCHFYWSGDGTTLIGVFAGQLAIAKLTKSDSSNPDKFLDGFSQPKLLPSLFRHTTPLFELSASDDGRICFAQKSGDNGTVTTFDLKKADYLFEMPIGNLKPTALEISPDGKLCALATRDECHVFDIETRKPIVVGVQDGVIKELFWSEDSTSLVAFLEIDAPIGDSPARYRQDQIKILDLEQKKWRSLDFDSLDLEPIQLSRSTPPVFQGNKIGVKVSDRNSLDSRFMALFDISTGELVERIPLPNSKPILRWNESLLISKDFNERAERVVGTSKASIFSRSNGELLKSMGSVNTFSLSPKYPCIALLMKSNGATPFSNADPLSIRIEKFDPESQEFQVLHQFDCRSASSKKLVWHPNEPVVAWSDIDTVYWYNTESEQLLGNELQSAGASIIATADGWLVADGVTLKKYNIRSELLETFFTVSPTASGPDWNGRFENSVGKGGKLTGKRSGDLQSVRIVGNRIENKIANPTK